MWTAQIGADVCVVEMHPQGDMVEYNQCQAMLRNLYELGIPGKVEEFTAYRILMLLHGRNRSGMTVACRSVVCTAC